MVNEVNNFRIKHTDVCAKLHSLLRGVVGQKSVSLKYLNVNSKLKYELSSSFVANSVEELVVEGEESITRIQ